MRRHLIAAAALLAPAAALAGAVPATAATHHTGAVSYAYVGNPAPLRVLRSHTQKCAGTLVYKKAASVAGKPVAELDVYTKPANGGTVIACMKHLGTTRGVRLATSVDVVGSPTLTSKKGVVALAAGKYVSYAGPVAIAGVKGKCFAAGGAIMVGKTKVVLAMKPVCTK